MYTMSPFYLIAVLAICYLTNASESQQTTAAKHAGNHHFAVMAPFIFPQLYRCPIKPSEFQLKTTFKSQGREDMWLDENIFQKEMTQKELATGTYLEIGALDGLTYSNTKYFEEKYGWRGILIEGHPTNQVKLREAEKTIRPNSAVFTTAICPLVNKQPGELNFTVGGGAIGTVASMAGKSFLKSFHKGKEEGVLPVSCIPMQRIIESTNMMDIDLFSLDVEGAELFVLQTINFHAVNIHVIVVELDNIQPEKDDAVRKLLAENGFENALNKYGNIRKICIGWGECPSNEVFVNPNYKARQQKKSQTYYQYGTSVKCV